MKFRIAVLVPAYNAEPYICEALESIAAQTRRPDQLIVVDDGSTDRTAEKVHDWMAMGNLDTKLFMQDKRGASAARNAALRHAEADLVAFMDADDVCLPTRLEILESAFEEIEDLAVCFGDSQAFNHSGIIATSAFHGKSITSLEYEERNGGLRLILGSVYSNLIFGTQIHLNSTLISKRVLENAGGFDEQITNAVDRDLFLRISRVGPFAYYQVPLSMIRRHDTNLTHERNALRIHRNIIKVLEKMLAQAGKLDLSAAEKQLTLEAGILQGHALLYSASRKGIGSYRKARRSLKAAGFSQPIYHPRHFLRALYYSLPKPQNDSQGA